LNIDGAIVIIGTLIHRLIITIIKIALEAIITALEDD